MKFIKSGVMIFMMVVCTVGPVCSIFAEDNPLSDKADINVEFPSEKFDYIIGPEDELDIYVWRHPDFSRSVIVRPDGKITLPVIDEVDVSGATPKELDNRITARYSELINNPQVTVFVKGFKSRKVIVLGEVRRPGIYPLYGRLSVLEAVTQAGYDKDRAALRSVMVIREKDGKPLGMRLDLIKVIRGENLDQNIKLEPDDIVFVPSSFIAEINTFIDLFFAKTKPAIDVYMAGWKAVVSPRSAQ